MHHLLRTGVRFLMHPSGPPPRPTRRNMAFDVALALVVGVGAVQWALTSLDGQDTAAIVGPRPPDGRLIAPDDVTAAAIAAVAVASAALVFRRRYPLAVLWAVLGVTLLASTDQPRLTFYACVIAAYSAAAYSPYRMPTLASVGAAVVAFSVAVDSVFPVVPEQYVPVIVLAPIAIAADGLRRWKLRADERSTQLAELEREQAEALRRAAEEERARIARELHDVVTHNVSVMVIQAGAARKVMKMSPEQAGEALLAVEAGGRTALTELRQAMGLLSAEGDGGSSSDAADPADLAPQPDMSSLSSLVSRVHEAGLEVDLTVSGQERPLLPGVELAAYRVVQEALTNTVKHASGASASVSVEYGDDQLRVEVVDTGGTPGESASSGNARGLIGLRERLAVYGGTLHAGPRLTSGYRVSAAIPLEAL